MHRACCSPRSRAHAPSLSLLHPPTHAYAHTHTYTHAHARVSKIGGGVHAAKSDNPSVRCLNNWGQATCCSGTCGLQHSAATPCTSTTSTRAAGSAAALRPRTRRWAKAYGAALAPRVMRCSQDCTALLMVWRKASPRSDVQGFICSTLQRYLFIWGLV